MKKQEASRSHRSDTRSERRKRQRARRRRRTRNRLILFGLWHPVIALAIDPNVIALLASVAQAIGA